jgi:hypothetical protein
MKKYVLYPGVGRVLPERKLEYVTGRQLAACYRVPYSECLDTDHPAIKKVITASKSPLHLVALVPEESGHYTLPDLSKSRIMVVKGIPDMVKKSG